MLDHTDRTPPTGEHELARPYRSSPRDVNHQVRMDHLSGPRWLHLSLFRFFMGTQAVIAAHLSHDSCTGHEEDFATQASGRGPRPRLAMIYSYTFFYCLFSGGWGKTKLNPRRFHVFHTCLSIEHNYVRNPALTGVSFG